jgi:hypothetical protein
MTTQAPSKEVTIQSKDAIRWQRPFNRILFGFIALVNIAQVADLPTDEGVEVLNV